ncbi:MAG: lipoprotein [Azoarcus sp.]|jgi:predicted small lipoprotein YifL|nr:lipoprotein [Azoarcus sp.]
MRVLIAAATACALLLSGCGVKGDLYLPPSDTAPVSAGAMPAEASPAVPPPANSPE